MVWKRSFSRPVEVFPWTQKVRSCSIKSGQELKTRNFNEIIVSALLGTSVVHWMKVTRKSECERLLQFEKEENMNVELTWRNGYTGKDVVVAIVDDGVWFNNSDILPNYVSTAHSSRL